MRAEYIHYGSDRYFPERVHEEVERFDCCYKPSGLWASRVDAYFGWKEWCEYESFNTESLNRNFKFTLKDSAKILHLHSMEDAMEILKINEIYGSTTFYKLDVEKLYSNYDGVELHISEDFNNFRRNNVFNMWDVDSICVWNSEIVEVIDV